MSDPSKQSIQELFACLKDSWKDPAQAENVKSYLQEVRDTFTGGSIEERLAKLVQDCHQGLAHRASAISKETEALFGKVSSDDPSLIECTGYNSNFRASFILGVAGGLTRLTCLYSDGSRRAFKGLEIGGDMLSMGFQAQSGPVTYNRAQNFCCGNRAKTIHENVFFQARSSGANPMIGVRTLFFASPKIKENTLFSSKLGRMRRGHRRAFSMNSEKGMHRGLQYRFGLFSSLEEGDLDFLIRGKKKTDQFDYLVQEVVDHILIQK